MDAPAAVDKSRDLLSAFLTSYGSTGEFIVRLGRHAATPVLFGLPKDDPSRVAITEETYGTRCSAEELKRMHQRLCTVADEVGAKVSQLFTNVEDATDARGSYLIRLPPPTVELAQEVRVAVVGNVDAGKSTTLGVLTRGSLDDGRGRARVTLFRHLHEQQTGRTSRYARPRLCLMPAHLT